MKESPPRTTRLKSGLSGNNLIAIILCQIFEKGAFLKKGIINTEAQINGHFTVKGPILRILKSVFQANVFARKNFA
ncbi:MAG TPA: hypothetical protein DCM38_13560 [Gammaproteobacteria bacterium]|nr:hypothetical protein [Gammaproteobacteria bacterium]